MLVLANYFQIMNKLAVLFWIVVVFIIFLSTRVTFANSNSLIISELMPNPVGDDSKLEWIELKNVSSSDISLGEWTLNDKVLPSFNIPPNAYLVLVKDENSFKTSFSQTAAIIKADFSMVNSGGKVTLKSNEGSIFEFNYTSSEEGKSFELLDGVCNTIQMHPESHSVGSLNTSCNQPTISPSNPPGDNSNSPTFINKVIINKVLPSPENGNEWIELRNLSSEKLNLQDWILQDESNKSYKIDSQSIEAYSVIKIYPSNISLNNDGDELRLIDNYGRQVDIFVYGKAIKGQVFEVGGIGATDEVDDEKQESNQEDVKEVKSISLENQKFESNTNRFYKKPILYKGKY